jgi:hypothetical protein
MAVPDTNTFSLQDVVDQFVKVNPPPDDLVDCFASAQSNFFDPSYEGNKDRLSNFRNYGGIWAGQFNTIVSGSLPSSTSWSNQVFTLSDSYIGHTVQVVWRYQSGSDYRGDLQLGGNVTLGETTFDLDTYIGTSWSTSRASTSSYSSVVWYPIATGTTALRWNKRSGSGTPSGGTGLTPPPYTGGDSTYYYTEVSGGGSPSKYFWLRSPVVTISSGNKTIDWWRGNYGTSMGNLNIYIDVIT